MLYADIRKVFVSLRKPNLQIKFKSNFKIQLAIKITKKFQWKQSNLNFMSESWLRISLKIYYYFCQQGPNPFSFWRSFRILFWSHDLCRIMGSAINFIVRGASAHEILFTALSNCTVLFLLQKTLSWYMLDYRLWSKFNRFRLDIRVRSLECSAQLNTFSLSSVFETEKCLSHTNSNSSVVFQENLVCCRNIRAILKSKPDY